jgi:hypothetical protein
MVSKKQSPPYPDADIIRLIEKIDLSTQRIDDKLSRGEDKIILSDIRKWKVNFDQDQALRDKESIQKGEMSKKCQQIYWNLLLAYERKAFDASIIREWQQTKRCDNFLKTSLEDVHSDYSRWIPEDSLERIIHYAEIPQDMKFANQAVFHYNSWHQKRLRQSLNWCKWWKYQTIHKVDRVESAVAIMVGIAGLIFSFRKRIGKKSDFQS